MFDAILALITTGVGGFLDLQKKKLESKLKIDEAETNAKIAQFERAQTTEADYDTAIVNQMALSWKDEWIVLILSLPFLGSFIPHIQDYVCTGWIYLAKAPQWYYFSFIGAVASSLGLRWMLGRFVPTPGISATAPMSFVEKTIDVLADTVTPAKGGTSSVPVKTNAVIPAKVLPSKTGTPKLAAVLAQQKPKDPKRPWLK